MNGSLTLSVLRIQSIARESHGRNKALYPSKAIVNPKIIPAEIIIFQIFRIIFNEIIFQTHPIIIQSIYRPMHPIISNS
jgi:hypothetical protein